MTLFAALTAKDGDGDAGGPSASSSSSSSPPEAIQLCSDRVIDFLNGTTVYLLNRGSSDESSGGESKREGSDGDAAEGRSRYFSALSYQAIQTQRDDGPPSNKTSGGAAAASRRHPRPDLGVWDCRVRGDDAGASATLLKRVVLNKMASPAQRPAPSDNLPGEEKKGEEAEAAEKKDGGVVVPPPPVVMAVDASNPAEVQPAVERMRNVLLSACDSDEKTARSYDDPRAQRTTSVGALRGSAFGKTLVKEDAAVGGDESSDDEKRIALILAVIVPSAIVSAASSSAAEEYKERQARALLLYHLHKFCLEVDCTLCFVGDGKGSSEALLGDGEGGEEEAGAAASAAENDPLLGRNTTMSIDELGRVIRRVALGLPPVEQGDVAEQTGSAGKGGADDGGEGGTDAPQRPPSIHAPGSHDAELIHGAYLRNASCEGQWDAGKDDLDVALPPPRSEEAASEGKATKDEKNPSGGGDEGWLSQLASSLGLSPDAAVTAAGPGEGSRSPMAVDRKNKASAVKKKQNRRSSVLRNKDSKPKDEKEVMNFFDNLLKK